MSRKLCLAVLCLAALVSPDDTAAQVPREPSDPLDALVVVDPRLRHAPAGSTLEGAAGLEPEVQAGWSRFAAEAGGPWKAYVDHRTGRIDAAEGAGIPWMNGAAADLDHLDRTARAFLSGSARMLGVDPATLALAPQRSGRIADHLWTVDYDVLRDGIKVEGARVVFRVNNGRLIQFGTENLPSPGAAVPPRKIGSKEALGALSLHVGGFTAGDTFVDGGTERLFPISMQGSAPGKGRGLVRAWEVTFRRKGSHGTWRALVDATSGELIDFRDVNHYAQVSGGVYPVSYIFNDEVVRPMPFADLSSGGFSNSAGVFAFPGGTVSSTLSGQYVRISDTCGLISNSSGSFGHIAFGTSGGTDCETPGSGGGGNTHAARTQFYHINRIKEVGRGWLPSNSWLGAQLQTNVNIFDVCNAYWDGFSINFFRSGSGCGNTGEIAAISLHEYGHGLDSNDGAGFSFQGSEAYADVTAALMLRDSCIGPGFRGTNCGGYGDACTSCTGVRDIDWAKHVSNTPHTVDNFNRPFCGSCGGGFPHCESYVASESIWDLAARDLPNPGSAEAWGITERLWYLSRPTATHAYTCNTSNIPWTSNGCSTGSWWRTMRAADDDDGNLANGTPNSCHLYAAFNRHGMACTTDPGASVCFSGCAPPAEPALALTPGNRQAALSWTSSGPGVTYDVFRSEAGCGAGFVKVASSVSGTDFLDTAVANNLTYSYRVVAHPAGNAACSSTPSECQAVMPQEPPCPSPPPAPAGLVATSQGIDRIALSWNAVPGTIEYQIFRSTTSGGPWTQIGAVAPPTTARLDTGLDPGTTYYYVVRAATGESCISANSAQASATTVNCQETVLYANDFEIGSGLSDWLVGSYDISSPEHWRGIQACAAHSGSKIFRFGGETCTGSYADGVNIFAEPQGPAGFAVPEGSLRTRLSFWHRWQFEHSFDGGSLSLSMDGNEFVGVPAAAITGATYSSTLVGGCHPPGSSGTPIFTGFQSGFVRTDVDLDQVCDLASGSNTGCGGSSVRLDFAALTDCSVLGQGWFLDDVTVSACIPHGCTGAPVIGTATTPADNQVLLTWSNGTPASTSYNVYRAVGSCAAPGPFTRIASGVTGTFLLDAPVSGGTTYAYRVAGLDETGICESDKSTCIDVVPTGPCTLLPTFAGLAAADDPALATCAVDLSWSPAASNCGGTVTYDVFRSTDPAFVPSPVNRIATGATGTSFNDSASLQYGTAYYYVVRAVDSVTGGSDPNTVRRRAIPTGPLVMQVTLQETFEGLGGFDLEGWTHFSSSGLPWIWSAARSQSPSHSWYGQGLAFNGDRILMSPPLQVGSGAVLSFWHTYEFEACFDGGTLEVSEDGFKWSSVPTFAFLAGGYTEQVYGTFNPIQGRPAWCHGTLGAMTEVQVDLSPWQGKTVQVRWHAGDDLSVASPGWYVDSVTFQNVLVENGCSSSPPPPLDFHTVTPCRLLDTRSTHAPALQPGQVRTFQLTGTCGLPATARAVSVNLTVIDPAAAGNLSIFRGDQVPPLSSSINFQGGVNRNNNALVPLSAAGEVRIRTNTTQPVHFVLDVNGYFQPDED